MQRVYHFFIVSSTFALCDALKTLAQISINKQNERLNDDWPLPGLGATEHSLFSTNATDSANFFLRYFKGSKMVRSDTSGDGGLHSKKIAVVEYCSRPDARCMYMKFIEDTAAPPSALTRNRAVAHRHQDFVHMSDSEWSRVASLAVSNAAEHKRAEGAYSTWIDFHDGITGETFDVDRAIADGVLLQKYNFGPLRVPLPHTLYTIELIGGFTEEAAQKLNEYAGVGQIDKCRDNEKGIEIGRQKAGIWWKATFASPNPKAASEFAVHALGAQRVESPFVHTSPDCPVVEWVVVPDQELQRTEKEADTPMVPRHAEGRLHEIPSGIMLHFISNPGWPTGNLTILDLAEEQGKIRNLRSDSFDEYMYNHVEFETTSLDPFIARFRKLDVPFIVRRGQDPNYFAIYVNVPENNMVFKISSTEAPRLARAHKFDEARNAI